MKALVKSKPIVGQEWPKGLKIEERPEPQIKDSGEVKLKVLAAALCGTDISIYNSTDALKESMKNINENGVITGHEFCSELVEAGEAAKKKIFDLILVFYADNQLVKDFINSRSKEEVVADPTWLDFVKNNFYLTAEMHLVCWQCRQCQNNESHACKNTIIKGLHQDGAFAPYVVVPSSNLIIFLKNELPVEIIAFMDAIGNATHTVQSAGVEGKNILILGAGIQGLMAVAVARKMGAAKIFINDASDPARGLTPEVLQSTKFAMAKKLGADYCFDVSLQKAEFEQKVKEVTNETGVDAVLEMSGSYYALADGFKNVRMAGVIALLGLPSGKMEVDFSKDIIFRGITVKGVIGRQMFKTWEVMRTILTSGLAELLIKSGIVTHDLPLEKFEEGFAALKKGEALKVLLRP
ncbi:MAG: zinc-binding dehydrogenase [Patescibacteria group bacterium]|jgi:threonine 3-dehydrogenase